jgi:hypothetical protein
MFLIDNWETVVKFLKGTWMKLVKFFEETDIGVSIQEHFELVLHPILLIVDAVKFLINSIPKIAGGIKNAFSGISGIVDKAKNLFGGEVEVGMGRGERAQTERIGVTTTSEQIARSIEEKRNTQEMILRNESRNELELQSGKVVFPGSSIFLEASG